MPSRPAVFLGLGSNVGDREGNLEAALRHLGERGFRTTARSAFYLTEPLDAPPQDWFVNAVVRGETGLCPEALLEACLAVEAELGRFREAHHGPRTIDIDVLLYGDEVRAAPRLTLPHPGLPDRLFVLIPLCEIAPGARHPVTGLTAVEMRGRCADTSGVLLLRPERARG